MLNSRSRQSSLILTATGAEASRSLEVSLWWQNYGSSRTAEFTHYLPTRYPHYRVDGDVFGMLLEDRDLIMRSRRLRLHEHGLP